MPSLDVLVIGTPSSGRAALSAALLDHARASGQAASCRILTQSSLAAAEALPWIQARLAEAAETEALVRLIVCTSGPVPDAAWRQATTPADVAQAVTAWSEDVRTLLALGVAAQCPLLVLRAEEMAAEPAMVLARAAAFADLPAPSTTATLALAPVAPPTIRAARAAMRTLAASDLPWILGYDVALPPLPATRDAALTRELAAWAGEELAAARDAALLHDVPVAVEAMKTLLDYFGPAFDELGLDLSYEALGIALCDILQSVQMDEPVALVARQLLAERPRCREAYRYLGLAQFALGASQAAVAPMTQFLRLSADEGTDPAYLAPEIARLSADLHPDDAGVHGYFAALGELPALAAAVEAALSRAPRQSRASRTVAALGLLRAARGDLDGAIHDLEDQLTFHSRSPEVQNALFALYARRAPDDPHFQLSRYFCPKPFENVDLLPGGAVHACCAVWQPQAMGNVYTTRDWRDVWNGDALQEMRASVLDGSYRYCNKLSCSFIQNGALPTHHDAAASDPRWRQVIDEQMTAIPFAPRTVNLAFDRSCNLSCPSCRESVLQANEKERAQMDEMTDRIVLPLLEDAKLVTITGSGDPFGSKTFRRLLMRLGEREYPHLDYNILTNGQLLTPETWEKFPRLKERIRHISVSVDAATPETYRILRRGGEFENLLPNLRYIGAHREAWGIEHFRLAFVVQKENFREMPAFVRLAREVGANEVQFQRLINWGTFSDADYADKAVCLPDHPLHAEFLALMQDPIFDDPLIELGMLRAFLPDGHRAQTQVAMPV